MAGTVNTYSGNSIASMYMQKGMQQAGNTSKIVTKPNPTPAPSKPVSTAAQQAQQRATNPTANAYVPAPQPAKTETLEVKPGKKEKKLEPKKVKEATKKETEAKKKAEAAKKEKVKKELQYKNAKAENVKNLSKSSVGTIKKIGSSTKVNASLNVNSLNHIYTNSYDASNSKNSIKVGNTKKYYKDANLELYAVENKDKDSKNKIYRIEKVDDSGKRTVMGYVNGSEVTVVNKKPNQKKSDPLLAKNSTAAIEASKGISKRDGTYNPKITPRPQKQEAKDTLEHKTPGNNQSGEKQGKKTATITYTKAASKSYGNTIAEQERQKALARVGVKDVAQKSSGADLFGAKTHSTKSVRLINGKQVEVETMTITPKNKKVATTKKIIEKEPEKKESAWEKIKTYGSFIGTVFVEGGFNVGEKARDWWANEYFINTIGKVRLYGLVAKNGIKSWGAMLSGDKKKLSQVGADALNDLDKYGASIGRIKDEIAVNDVKDYMMDPYYEEKGYYKKIKNAEKIRSIGNALGEMATMVGVSYIASGAVEEGVESGAKKVAESGIKRITSRVTEKGFFQAAKELGKEGMTNTLKTFAGDGKYVRMALAKYTSQGEKLQESYQKGDSVFAANKKAYLYGNWNALQWMFGEDINELNLIKGSSAATKVANRGARVLIDGGDNALEGLVNPLIESIGSTKVEPVHKDKNKDGKINSLSELSLSVSNKSFGECFKEAGGTSNLVTQFLTGMGMSAAGESLDALGTFKDIKTPERTIDNAIDDIKLKRITKEEEKKLGKNVQEILASSKEATPEVDIKKVEAGSPKKNSLDVNEKVKTDSPSTKNTTDKVKTENKKLKNTISDKEAIKNLAYSEAEKATGSTIKSRLGLAASIDTTMKAISDKLSAKKIAKAAKTADSVKLKTDVNAKNIDSTPSAKGLKVSETVNGIGKKASAAVSTAADKAKKAADSIVTKAKQTGDTVSGLGKKASDAVDSVGEKAKKTVTNSASGAKTNIEELIEKSKKKLTDTLENGKRVTSSNTKSDVSYKSDKRDIEKGLKSIDTKFGSSDSGIKRLSVFSETGNETYLENAVFGSKIAYDMDKGSIKRYLEEVDGPFQSKKRALDSAIKELTDGKLSEEDAYKFLAEYNAHRNSNVLPADSKLKKIIDDTPDSVMNRYIEETVMKAYNGDINIKSYSTFDSLLNSTKEHSKLRNSLQSMYENDKPAFKKVLKEKGFSDAQIDSVMKSNKMKNLVEFASSGKTIKEADGVLRGLEVKKTSKSVDSVVTKPKQVGNVKKYSSLEDALESSKNPIGNLEALDKISKKFDQYKNMDPKQLSGEDPYYHAMVHYYDIKKKAPTQKTIDSFWKRITKDGAYPTVQGTYKGLGSNPAISSKKMYDDITGGETAFVHVKSRYWNPEDEARLYLNMEHEDLYRILPEFMDECEKQGLDYYFKVPGITSSTKGANLKYSTRDDACVFYTDAECTEKYINILNQIKERHPEIKPYKPPIATSEIDGYIGYAPKTGDKSYNSVQASLLRGNRDSALKKYVGADGKISDEKYVEFLQEWGRMSGINVTPNSGLKQVELNIKAASTTQKSVDIKNNSSTTTVQKKSLKQSIESYKEKLEESLDSRFKKIKENADANKKAKELKKAEQQEISAKKKQQAEAEKRFKREESERLKQQKLEEKKQKQAEAYWKKQEKEWNRYSKMQQNQAKKQKQLVETLSGEYDKNINKIFKRFKEKGFNDEQITSLLNSNPKGSVISFLASGKGIREANELKFDVVTNKLNVKAKDKVSIKDKLLDQSKINAKALKKEIQATITPNMSVIEKSRKLYIELSKRMHYDANYMFGSEQTQNAILNSIKGFSDLKSDNVVCFGWAHLYNEILRENGVDSRIVLSSGGKHAWVEIKLPDGRIVVADATEAIGGSTDLVNCKSNFDTVGFAVLDSKYSGQRLSKINYTSRNEAEFNRLEKQLNEAAQSGATVSDSLVKRHAELADKRNNPLRIDLDVHGKQLDNLDSSVGYYKVNYDKDIKGAQSLFKGQSDTIGLRDTLSANGKGILDLPIKDNMDGLEAYSYLRKLQESGSFGNQDSVNLTWCGNNIGTNSKDNYEVLLQAVDKATGRCMIYSKSLGRIDFTNRGDFNLFLDKLNIHYRV